MKARWGGVLGVLVLALVGCGVRPTGPIAAGEPASGLTRGMRLYFASDGGLRAVPLLDREITDLGMVVKLLAAGPPPAERRDGLTTLVQGLGGYTVAGTGARVTVRLEDPYTGNGRDQATGQLVCTLARAQSVLEPAVRPEDVEVILRPPEDPAAGPYRCADFLAG
ncbi:GerMN domain-containing protein [Streptomyces sp. bgisy082]|uniref:GerMN domain-containing protein n=1 Tax=Streptomyces sp. bgisy082 TaxID=3413776 RepID=UPI003D70CA30